MKIETYEQAQYIRESINHMKIKKSQIEKMKKRENDDEFNLAREIAFDSIHYAVRRLENDFKNL